MALVGLGAKLVWRRHLREPRVLPQLRLPSRFRRRIRRPGPMEPRSQSSPRYFLSERATVRPVRSSIARRRGSHGQPLWGRPIVRYQPRRAPGHAEWSSSVWRQQVHRAGRAELAQCRFAGRIARVPGTAGGTARISGISDGVRRISGIAEFPRYGSARRIPQLPIGSQTIIPKHPQI